MNIPVITVTNVSKAVAGRQLLAGVTFTIQAQSLVSLIGPNGAGKSTLVHILLGLDTQHTGTIQINDNERIRYIPQVTTQDHQQISLSVAEYLRIGSTRLLSGQTQAPDFPAALRHVGVSDAVLSQTFSSLSGGERQRVAIARALLSNPTILVLDEPLAAVDYASRPGLYELIRHLQKVHHMTVLLVSHDIDSILPVSDQILCLNVTLQQDCHPKHVSNGTATTRTVHHHC